jgi:hypothetical protein
MTTLNHAVTGAVIAVAIKAPALAIPLALLSHYVCDAIPHFGIHEHDHVKRNASLLFRAVTITSVAGMLLLLVLAPLRGYHDVSWVTVIACMVAAALPDIVWVPMYFRELKSKQEKPLGKFDRFHQVIQWYEKPLGLSVEAIWLFSASYILLFVAK